jgi:hypothetical protein
MAVAAPQNSHPDEYLHVEAARYYGPHWLPPSLSDEWVIPSLSHYGVTYLATPDMGYFFAGKFAFLSRFLFPDVFTALRFFNVVLLASLFFWSARVFRESPATGIFFLTPQLWYAFSAYNTEGWAFFVSLLLVGQVAAKDSSLQQYLSPPPSGAIRRIVPALLLSCLLALTKMNFFVIVFSFFVVWLIWQLVTCWSESRLGHGMMRILPLILLPLMLRFGVQTYQNAVNHRDLPRDPGAGGEMQPDFKPSDSCARRRIRRASHARARRQPGGSLNSLSMALHDSN